MTEKGKGCQLTFWLLSIPQFVLCNSADLYAYIIVCCVICWSCVFRFFSARKFWCGLCRTGLRRFYRCCCPFPCIGSLGRNSVLSRDVLDGKNSWYRWAEWRFQGIIAAVFPYSILKYLHIYPVPHTYDLPACTAIRCTVYPISSFKCFAIF